MKEIGNSQWRPLPEGVHPRCFKCSKSVDNFTGYYNETSEICRLRAECHGDVQEVQICSDSLIAMGLRGFIAFLESTLAQEVEDGD